MLGEFPWQVRVGETIAAKDYIAPPRILSSESTTAETVWSSGEYVSGAEIWQAFQLPGAPPSRRHLSQSAVALRSEVKGTVAHVLLLPAGGVCC